MTQNIKKNKNKNKKAETGKGNIKHRSNKIP